MSNELMKEKLWEIEQLKARIAELEAEKRSAAEEIEKAIDERNTLEQQAQKRLAPQKTQVIKPIVVDYNRYGAVPRSGDDIVFTMRQGNKVEQFGNPFSSGKGNTIRVGSVKESVDSYIRWLSDPEAEFTDVNGKIHKHVLPERRAWILDQIDSGRLDGKKLVYYKQPDVEGGKYYSHADALADFVAARRTNTTTTLTDRPQGGADECDGNEAKSGGGREMNTRPIDEPIKIVPIDMSEVCEYYPNGCEFCDYNCSGWCSLYCADVPSQEEE